MSGSEELVNFVHHITNKTIKLNQKILTFNCDY